MSLLRDPKTPHRNYGDKVTLIGGEEDPDPFRD